MSIVSGSLEPFSSFVVADRPDSICLIADSVWAVSWSSSRIVPAIVGSASRRYREISSSAASMSAKACLSAAMSSIVLDACSWIWVPCVLRRSAVPAIIADVVVLIAWILSSTIFWWASASATVTATCSALMVTSRARSTPRMSSRLLRMMISIASTPC